MACKFCEQLLGPAVAAIQEGGLYGWLAVLFLFTARMAWAVLIKGLGMMLPTLQEQFGTSTWSVGWMVAMVDASVGLSGVFASPLQERFGVRTVAIVSGLVAVASMTVASFLSNLYLIASILTLFTGPAIGISFITSKELVGRYFSTSLPLAYGIGTVGSGLSYVALVPLIQLFLNIYGWRGTMLLLGGIFSHLVVCGALLRPPAARGSNDDYQSVHVDEDHGTGDDEVVPNSRRECSCCTKVYSFINDTFRLGLFSSITFWLVAFIVCVWRLLYSTWLIYYVQYTTVYKGLSLDDASHSIVSYGIGRVVGCIISGPLVRTFAMISGYTWVGMSMITMSIYYFADPWLTSFWAIAGMSFVYGNAVSFAIIIMDVISKDIFGVDRIGVVFGWMAFISGTTGLLLLYFPGLIYDTIGSYLVVFSLMGGVQALTVLALLGLSRRLKRRQDSTLGSNVPVRDEPSLRIQTE